METEYIEGGLRETAPEPPSLLRGRILQRVSEAAVQRQKQGAWWQPRMGAACRLAGAVAVAGGIYAGLTFTSPGPSTPAFAQVEQAMQEIKTVHWIEKHIVTSGDGRRVREDEDNVWVRLAY